MKHNFFFVFIQIQLISHIELIVINENITVPVGDTLRIKCPNSIALRSPFMWLVNCASVEDRKYELSNGSLIIANVTEGDSGVYTCKPKKKLRRSKKIAHFNVHVVRRSDYEANNVSTDFAPQFVKKHLMISWYINRRSGQSVRFNCPFIGKPKPEIVWKKDDHIFRRKNGHSFDYLKGYILRLENVTPGDSGLYTCFVSNIFGSINYTYELVVENHYIHPPIFERGINETVYAEIHTDVNLDCTFGEDEDFDIDWGWIRLWKIEDYNGHRNKSSLRISKDKKYVFELIPDKYDYDDNPTIDNYDAEYNSTSLLLSNITADDFGEYMCLARNYHGQSSRLIQLLRLERNATKEHIIYQQVDSGMSNAMKYGAVMLTISLCASAYCCIKYFQKREIIVKAERTYFIRKNVFKSDCPLKSFIPKFKIEEIGKKVPVKYDRIVVTYNIPVDINWEILRDRVIIEEQIGEGAFGVVFKAKLRRCYSNSYTDVAVKTLKLEHKDEDVISLLQEIEIMKRVGKHENVISLLGCCLKKGPILLIMECASKGNLKNFLTKLSNYPNQVSTHDFIEFALQIASGMQHLASRDCVHRDLAARNVLVSDNNLMKISDFGLARNLSSDGYYKVKNSDQVMPVRWMAPEAWRLSLFSTKSDVWSFAVLLWEIFTFAAQPYDSIDDTQSLWNYIEKGLRLSKPDSCPDSIYKLMNRCWNENASQRPDFFEIVNCLREEK